MIFSIVKDLFKRFEGLCRSVIVLVGCTGGLNVDLGGLRFSCSKVLHTLSNFELKVILVRFHKK